MLINGLLTLEANCTTIADALAALNNNGVIFIDVVIY